jgi:hypothetical protein
MSVEQVFQRQSLLVDASRMRAVYRVVPALVVVGVLTSIGWAGCGGRGSGSGFGSGSSSGGDGGNSGSEDGSLIFGQGEDGGSSGGNSQPYMFATDGGIVAVGSCPGGGSTTISGKIYDPAAKDPLYGAVAYVPSKPVSALTLGVSCDSCNSLYTGSPIAAGQTDATGHFVIQNAPYGTNIPLVIQLGKWRKQVKVSTVTACQDNPQPDKSLTLPATHLEGDIPNIAISTGGADTLECLLLRMGVAASEYEPGGQGPGRIHIFQGSGAGGFTAPITIPGLNLGNVGAPNTNPAAPSSSSALWNSDADINDFDIVMLSCEGSPTANMDQQVLFDYAKAGGRVFASHFHYAWFNTGPFGTSTPALAEWTTGGQDIGNVNALVETTLLNGGAFPKGVAMKQWLGVVDALGVAGAPAGELPIVAARHNANLTAANTPSTSWIVPDPSANQSTGTTQYFSFNTPLGMSTETQCGRVVYSDLHVGGASSDNPSMPVPEECSTADLSPQEKALEFMLFDLSACVVPDNAPPAQVMIVPQ